MNQQVEKSGIDKFLEHATVMYLLIGVVSISAAVILFNVGGSLAEVTGQENTILGFSFEAGGAIGGFLLIFWTSPKVIAMLNAAKITTSSKSPLDNIPDSLGFEQLLTEFRSTLDNVEAKDAKLAIYFKDQGDFPRLLDGLYSGILYVSRALNTGHVNPLFYGNLMELDKKQNQLRVRYFAGPYNEEIITRKFPLFGTNQGVASIAFTSKEIQIRNSTEEELKVRGEQRLQAMMSIPIERFDECPNGAIAVLNIDSAIGNVFPVEGSHNTVLRQRAEELKKLLQRVNRLRSKFMPESP